jgi:hypothetical protein
MRKILLLIFYIAITSSCLDEQDATTASPATFVRFFNGGGNDFAIKALESADNSIMILANSRYSLVEISSEVQKIKLIKTDAFGNSLWTKFYPDFGTTDNYRANSFVALANGNFIIVGEKVTTPKNQLLVIEIDKEGTTVQELVYTNTVDPVALSGYALTTSANGNYIVLSKVDDVDKPAIEMAICEIDKANYSVLWQKTYGASKGSLARKVFYDNSSKIYWGGTMKSNNSDYVRLLRVAPNAQHTDFDIPFGEPQFNERAIDMVRVGNGFVMAGTTNKKGSGSAATAGDDDLLFKRVTDNGDLVFQKTYPIDGTNEEASAINITRDGGFVLLGNLETTPENKGRGDKDFYIIRTDSFGNVRWEKSFGSKFNDTGADVLELSDKSILVLGTTRLGGLFTVMMIKMDQNGTIN